jgi:hypothetical protein
MTTVKRLLAIGTILMGTSWAAQAGTLFNNTGSDSGSATGFLIASSPSGDGALGQSFMTGSAAEALSDVQLYVWANLNPTGGSFVVTLNADLGGSPDLGSPLLTLGTVMDTDLSGVADFSGQNYLLSPNTSYWIVATDTSSGSGATIDTLSLDPTLATQGFWDTALDYAGLGVLGTSTYVDGSSTVVSDAPGSQSLGPLVMLVQAVDAPEPLSLAMLGAGLVGLGLVRSRRKQ